LLSSHLHIELPSRHFPVDDDDYEDGDDDDDDDDKGKSNGTAVSKRPTAPALMTVS
jgi:hypothetical protein